MHATVPSIVAGISVNSCLFHEILCMSLLWLIELSQVGVAQAENMSECQRIFEVHGDVCLQSPKDSSSVLPLLLK